MAVAVAREVGGSGGTSEEERRDAADGGERLLQRPHLERLVLEEVPKNNEETYVTSIYCGVTLIVKVDFVQIQKLLRSYQVTSDSGA